MHIRTLVNAGPASHTVSLPKDWITKNKLNKGSVVYIEEKSDAELLVTPQMHQQREPAKKELTISIDNKDQGTIQRELTAAYVNNYSSIIFSGKQVEKNAKLLRSIVQEFVALEVADQSASHMIVKDLLNLEEISIEQTLRRIDMIIRSMLKDSIAALEGKHVLDKIEYKDEDINRLYFLLYRLLKSALIDSHFAEKLSLSNAEILGRWYLIVNLENVADCGKNICKILSSLEKNQDKEKLKELYHQIQESYELAMKSFFSKNKNSADDVAKRRIPLFDVCDSYFEKNKTAQTALLIEQFKSMESLICNIARIVIDHE